MMNQQEIEELNLGPWECLQDASYYDMWLVRQVHDRTFGHGYHLVNGDEAAALRDMLNASDGHPNAADYRNRAERAEAELAEVRDTIRIAARWFEQAAINHEIAAEVSGPNENAAYVEAARRDTYRGKFLRAALNGGNHD